MSRCLVLIGLLLFSGSLLASSFAGTSAGASSAGSSDSSGSSSGDDDKVVAQAREDAAVFVATDGRVRSARLEAALRQLRETSAQSGEASDLQLAHAILSR
ncbi:DUF2388 domain-containing protein [Pseudoxanthomonas dokdonensis]|uniref:DUF2388 domain-containing protein n=1 Tax=Pseudoxanthomonas dokdonensis TaxID=344882 RepID=A0A0R0D023_9GAMM|nr:DUF2388 domain-containing protein [Pseudoxanthomonas dokdonensis]KRG70963.1 hypothetical protein ABB29_03785 [Pseudoxanthomonas dokdonensis]